MHMKKILVPTDGSETSKTAALQAIELAKTYGSFVTFLTVVEVEGDAFYGDYGMVSSADYVNLSDTLITIKKERQSAMLQSLLAGLDCAGIETETKVVVGSAHPEIVETAKNGKYDLIVMGHRGLNPVKRLFLGSVAKRVIEDAPCSVLIVKARHEEQRP
jgi:nucleotide-binding universal stress UspA family protein